MISVTNEPATESQPDRWDGFTAPELTVIKESVRQFADSILIQAAADEIPADYRNDAALTLLGAANLCTEIDEQLGNPHPPFEVFATAAGLISQGKYAGMLAELAEDEVIEVPSATDDEDGGADDSDA